MHLYGAILVATITVPMTLRHVSAFVTPVHTIARPLAGGNILGGCRMTASVAPLPACSRLPALNPETAEVKAERLWSMADARASIPLGGSKADDKYSNLKTCRKSFEVDSAEESDNFFEEEGRASVLRRYHYDEFVDLDDSSDDKEYYI